MCGGRSSILQYGPLIETNTLYAPTPNGNVRVRRKINAPRPRYSYCGLSYLNHRVLYIKTQLKFTFLFFLFRKYQPVIKPTIFQQTHAVLFHCEYSALRINI